MKNSELKNLLIHKLNDLVVKAINTNKFDNLEVDKIFIERRELWDLIDSIEDEYTEAYKKWKEKNEYISKNK